MQRMNSGAKELLPGLIAGDIWNMKDMLDRKPDTIVVLDRLPASVWDSGFEGEILYYPIEPFGVLPTKMLERLTGEIETRVRDGKRVAIFSREDCGRIGYVAACALFQLGVREPVYHIRRTWSAAALPVDAQESEVALFCYRHIAKIFWHCQQKSAHIQIDSIEAFQSDEDILRQFRRIEGALGEEARMILRFSGLLPSVRIMVEAASEALCEKALDDFIEVIKQTGHFVAIVAE